MKTRILAIISLILCLLLIMGVLPFGFIFVNAAEKATLTLSETKVTLGDNKPITITVTSGENGLKANKTYVIRMFKSYNSPEYGGLGITSGLNQDYIFANGYNNVGAGNVTTDSNGAFTKTFTTHTTSITETGYYTYAIMDDWTTVATANFEVTERINKYSKYINYRDPLTHTYKRLTEDKKLNIVYFGGSVTAGYGSTDASYSWRGLSMKWFRERFPQASINFIDSSIGESGTYLGTFRLREDVIKRKPDLLFIEYAINDTYKGSTKEQAALQYETVVREVREALPNCDIVTLLVTNQSVAKLLPELYPTAAGHAEMAEKYNISTINVGQALVDSLTDFEKEWNTYFIDTVHPSNEGYKKYYDCLEEYLSNALLYTDYSSLSEGHISPELQSESLLDGTRMALVGAKMKSYVIDSKGFEYSSDLFKGPVETPHIGYYHTEKNTDSYITFRFFGTEFAMWSNFYDKSTVTISVDGGKETAIVCDRHAPTMLVSELAPGGHTIVIKPKVYGEDDFMNIGAVFFRDDTKQTGKAVDPSTREPIGGTGDDNHSHNYTEWVYDNDIHYRKCQCGDVTDWGYHNLNEEESCGICGYKNIISDIDATLTMSETSIYLGDDTPITLTVTGGKGGLEPNKVYYVRLTKSSATVNDSGFNNKGLCSYTFADGTIYPAVSVATDEFGGFTKELTLHNSKITEVGIYTYCVMDGWDTKATANFEVTQRDDICRFTNTTNEFYVGKEVKLTYKNLPIDSYDTVDIKLYRWTEDWYYRGNMKFVSYGTLKAASGTITYSAANMENYGGAGTYIAVLGGTGWTNLAEFKFTYVPNPKNMTIAQTTVYRGENLRLSLSGVKSGDAVGVFAKGVPNYTILGDTWKSLKDGLTETVISTYKLTPGEYTVGFWSTGWNFSGRINIVIKKLDNDINYDAKVDIKDLIRIKKIAAGLVDSNSDANLNGDSKIDSLDINFLRKVILNIEN